MLVHGTRLLLATLIAGSLHPWWLPLLVHVINTVLWAFGRGNEAHCAEVSLLSISAIAAVSAEGGRAQGGLSLSGVSIGVGQVQLRHWQTVHGDPDSRSGR